MPTLLPIHLANRVSPSAESVHVAFSFFLRGQNHWYDHGTRRQVPLIHLNLQQQETIISMSVLSTTDVFTDAH